MTNWIKPEDRNPPRHTRLLFLDEHGKIWEGDMCYGMHAPWYCTHSPSRAETIILNDSYLKIVGWMLKDDAMKLLEGPKNSS